MFDRLKKAFAKEAKPTPDDESPSQLSVGPMSEWAATQGFGFSVLDGGQNIALEGKIGGKAWRLQLGKPTRNYIFGEEVRGRAELGIQEDVAVLVMNRPLKEALEKRAYEMYTNTLQTQVDSSLPEEMRWLAMFEEVAWEKLPDEFWARFSVLTDNRACALAWIDPQLANLLTEWPRPAPSAEVPFILLLLNGKAYLRMEYTPSELGTIQHAALIFQNACEAAVSVFAKK